MTAAPAQPPVTPKTADDLGHPIRYPLLIDDVWRSCCACHWWDVVAPPKDVVK